MVMIQYYKDLIATVTHEKLVFWLEKNGYKYKIQDSWIHWTAKNLSLKNYLFFHDTWHEKSFIALSEDTNKPIDHIVHEMRGVQKPDNIERLKAITNEQWRTFAEKYNLEFEIDCNDMFNIYKSRNNRLCPQYLYIRDNDLEQRRRVLDTLLFFKNILAESISEFEYAQNIHDLITELESM